MVISYLVLVKPVKVGVVGRVSLDRDFGVTKVYFIHTVKQCNMSKCVGARST